MPENENSFTCYNVQNFQGFMSFLWHRQMICSIIAKKWQNKPHIIIFHKNNNVVIPFLGVAEQNESDFSVKIEESLVLGIGTAGVSLTLL